MPLLDNFVDPFSILSKDNITKTLSNLQHDRDALAEILADLASKSDICMSDTGKFLGCPIYSQRCDGKCKLITKEAWIKLVENSRN